RPARRSPARVWLRRGDGHARRGRRRSRRTGHGARRRTGGGRMSYLALAATNVVRSPVRSALRAVILAAAVALLGAMLLFIGRSLQTMTSSATRSVPLDWQSPSSSYATAVRAARGVARQNGVVEAVPAATASFAGAEHTKAGVGTIRSAAGAILAVPPNYLDRL